MVDSFCGCGHDDSGERGLAATFSIACEARSCPAVLRALRGAQSAEIAGLRTIASRRDWRIYVPKPKALALDEANEHLSPGSDYTSYGTSLPVPTQKESFLVSRRMSLWKRVLIQQSDLRRIRSVDRKYFLLEFCWAFTPGLEIPPPQLQSCTIDPLSAVFCQNSRSLCIATIPFWISSLNA